MVRKTLVTLLLVATAALPLSAELKYTSHLEMKKVGEPSNPAFGMAAEMLVQMMAPGGSQDSTCTVGEKGMRIENAKGTPTMPDGSVQFVRPDGSILVMNPKDKTFWKVPTGDAAGMMAQMNPRVTTKRTGEFATVSGMKAEKITIEISMDLPIPAGVELPPGMSATMTMNGEMWMADEYKTYAAMMKKGGNSVLASMGFGSKMMEGLDGLMVRQTMRGDVFGGYEMDTTLSKLSEEKVAADFFEIPKDYKEIPMPGIGGIGGIGARR